MKKILLSLLIVTALMFMATPVSAAATDQPLPLPEIFYGTVIQGAAPAPAGTVIEARGEGVVNGSGNPIIVVQPGIYSSSDPLANSPRLFVQGNIPEGTEITFYVNGVLANETANFYPGTGMELNLTAPPLAQSGAVSGGGGGGGSGGSTVSTVSITAAVSGFQADNPVLLNSSGQLLNDVALTDNAKTFSLNIQKSTAITVDGVVSTTLTADPVDVTTLPSTPNTAILLAQNFGPDGTNFSLEATLTMTYDPAVLPAGIEPQNLAIAWWDTVTAKWVKLDSTVDTAAGSITALIQHFTIYAIIGDITEVTAVAVAPAPIVPEPETPATPAPVQVIADVPTEPEPEAPVISATIPAVPEIPAAVPASMNWIWLIVAAILVILLVSLYYMKRRSRE